VQFSISSATLALLAEENAQLKDDIDRKMKQIKEYKYLMDEFNEKLEAEVMKSEQMKLMLRTVESSRSWGFGARNE
jgi:predicted RNase H-like nuclease (RuvC/YqgF family)